MRTTKVLIEQHFIDFLESPKNNYVKGAPDYTKPIFEDEWSPFKQFLAATTPNRKLRLTITLEVADE